MLDVKLTREEMKKLHDEASQFEEKYSAETPSDDDQKLQDERFARLEKLAKTLEANEKLAKFAYSKEQDVKATVVLPKFEKAADTVVHEPTREDYSKALSQYVQGEVEEKYSTIITTTGGGALIPPIVSAPIYPLNTNTYRRAYAAFGLTPESFGTAAPANIPVITLNAGGVIVEGQQNTCGSDNGQNTGFVTITPKGYHSLPIWYSNMTIASVNYDVTTSTLPALKAACDLGYANAITAAILADSSITQVVATASVSTLSLDNLDDLNQSFSPIYDQNKFIMLSPLAYNAAEKLKDSTGLPIMARNDIQNLHFLSYKGTPVFKDASLSGFGANNVVGLAISLTGFKLRDELEKLIVYTQDPCYTDMTGLDFVKYEGFGYVSAAVSKLKCPAS